MLRVFEIKCIYAWICYIGITNGTPIFQGIKVQRGFDIEFTPFTFKPLSFFNEKWSPLGVYGVRKGIQRRDLGSANSFKGDPQPPLSLPQPAPAPVHETIEEAKQVQIYNNIQTPPRELALGPDPVNRGLSNVIRIPIPNNFKPSADGLYTNIGYNLPVNYVKEMPNDVFSGVLYGELPPRPIGPIPAQAPVAITVVPLITPPPSLPLVSQNSPSPEIPPTEGPLVRGSRLAVYLGNTFKKMVSEFFANAKIQIKQFSSPSPNTSTSQ